MKKETVHLFAFPTAALRQQFIADITALDPDVSYATSRSTGQGAPVDTFIVAVRQP